MCTWYRSSWLLRDGRAIKQVGQDVLYRHGRGLRSLTSRDRYQAGNPGFLAVLFAGTGHLGGAHRLGIYAIPDGVGSRLAPRPGLGRMTGVAGIAADHGGGAPMPVAAITGGGGGHR